MAGPRRAAPPLPSLPASSCYIGAPIAPSHTHSHKNAIVIFISLFSHLRLQGANALLLTARGRPPRVAVPQPAARSNCSIAAAPDDGTSIHSGGYYRAGLDRDASQNRTDTPHPCTLDVPVPTPAMIRQVYKRESRAEQTHSEDPKCRCEKLLTWSEHLDADA